MEWLEGGDEERAALECVAAERELCVLARARCDACLCTRTWSGACVRESLSEAVRPSLQRVVKNLFN